MLEHLRKFSFQHPVPLFEISKLDRGHMANLLFQTAQQLGILPYSAT
jgi:hypothetical protein